MLDIKTGDKIKVYDISETLIGEGTFKRVHLYPEDKKTQYECEELSIVAEGEHIVEVNGKTYKVSEPKDWEKGIV